MPTDHHRSSSITTIASIGRSVLSLRRNSMEDEEELQDLDLFQCHVTNHLLSLSSNNQETIIPSLPFLSKLFHTLLSCVEEFKNVISRNPGLITAKPPSDHRHVSNLLVKFLDVLISITENIRSLRRRNRYADIAATARCQSLPGVRRAKKALANLLLASSERDPIRKMTAGITSSPSGGGLAVAVYTMSSVLVFATWALAAAFSRCPSAVPVVGSGRQLAWGPVMIGIRERIRKGGMLLVEYGEVERCGREMMGLAVGPEIVAKAEELREKSVRLEEGLGEFEREVRKVFCRVVRDRDEVMRFMEKNDKCVTPFIVLG